MYKSQRSVILWNFENCPLPSGKSALKFVKYVREKFCVDYTEVKFLVICDTTKLATEVYEELVKSLVEIENVSGTPKNAADDSLRQNMRGIAEDYVAPLTVVIITGDGNLLPELIDMQHRCKFKVILIHNQQTSKGLTVFASECHKFEVFCMDLVEITTKNEPKTLNKRSQYKENLNIKKSYLSRHEEKCQELKESIDSFENSISYCDEIDTETRRYRCLCDMKKEFLKATNSVLTTSVTKFNFECRQLSKSYPVYGHRRKIINAIISNQVTILSANPGCGKTTQVFQYIFQLYNIEKSKLVFIQPQNSLLKYFTSTISHQLKNFTEFKSLLKNFKKSCFFTSHSFLLECFEDKLLYGIKYIIIDDAQERDVTTEILLGYLKKILSRREDLHLLVMATPDRANEFSEFYNKCEIIEIDYPHYPVEIIWEVPHQNYVKAAVKKALDILQSEENGDILVFLPNASDVNFASNLTIKKLGTLMVVKVHKLLLTYNFDQTCKNVQQSSSRKIIFTTGEEAKIISLPNIRFVVDSGLTTEYRCEINRKFVETKFITLSSAEFRASAAGLNSPGKCYRLFSSDNLSSNVAKRKSNELQVLFVLNFGLNPFLFKYIDPLTSDEIASALTELEKIKAVDENFVTFKGKCLLRLPLDIHLSNILMEGISNGVGSDMLCLVTIASLDIFLLPTNLLQLVEDYLQFSKQNSEKKQFFKDDIIKFEIMNIIEKKVRVLQEILKEMSILVPVIPQGNNWKFQLLKVISVCWWDNLCILQNPQDGVYLWCLEETSLQVKPSLPDVNYPRCLIFETYLWNVREGDFVANFIPIIEIILNDQQKSEVLKNFIATRKQTRFGIGPLGRQVLSNISIGNYALQKSQWEKQLSNLENGLVNLTVFPNTGVLEIYCANNSYKKKVREEIVKEIRDTQNKMMEEVMEFCICPESGMGIILENSARVRNLMMTSYCNTLVVSHLLTAIIDKLVEVHTKRGKIIRCNEKIVASDRKEMKIIFDDPTSAKQAFHQFEGLIPTPHLEIHDQFKSCVVLNIQWTRRLNLGTATIQFDKYPSCFHHKIKCYPGAIQEHDDKKCRLILNNLDRKLSKQEIVSKLEAELIDTDIKIKNCHLLQEPGFRSSLEDLSKIKNKLSDLVTPIFAENDVRILVEEPNSKDETWTATVSSNSFQVSHSLLNSICNKTLDRRRLRVTIDYSYFLFCGPELFDTVKSDFQRDLEERRANVEKKNCNLRVCTEVANNGKIAVEIVGNDLEEVIFCYQCLATRLRSYTFNVSDYELLTEKFSDDDERQEILDKFAKNANAFVGYNKFSNQISVVDNPEVKKNLRRQLHLEIANLELLDEAVFNCNSPGTIRELVKEYNPKLTDLKKITGAGHVELNIKSKNIKVIGDDEAVNKIEAILKSAAVKLKSSSTNNVKKSPIEICPICSDDVHKDDFNYRMESCGHAYCFPCFTAFIANSNPPIFCVVRDCFQPIVIRDLKILENSPIFRKLAERATSIFVNENKSKFLYCVLPDCDGILSQSINEDCCSKCYNKICFNCQVVYHYGLTCSKYQRNYSHCSSKNSKRTHLKNSYWNL